MAGINLIISPHADDEVLGASSFLGGDTVVLVVSINESKIEGRPTHITRKKEFEKAMKLNGTECSVMSNIPVNEYHKHMPLLTHLIEESIKHLEPDMILIPNISTNNDHTTVHECCMTALRKHDTIPFVKKVLVFEGPQDFFSKHRMQAGYYKTVNMRNKIKTYCNYRSQQRSYRNKNILDAMARIRGLESNNEYAEGFEVIRWCE